MKMILIGLITSVILVGGFGYLESNNELNHESISYKETNNLNNTLEFNLCKATKKDECTKKIQKKKGKIFYGKKDIKDNNSEKDAKKYNKINKKVKNNEQKKTNSKSKNKKNKSKNENTKKKVNINKKDETTKNVIEYKVNKTKIAEMKKIINSNPSSDMTKFGYNIVVDSSIVNNTNEFTYTEKRVKSKMTNKFGTIRIYARDYYFNGEYISTQCFII